MSEQAGSNHSRILLGVTGGVAAYKSAELVRLLTRAGHEVQVVMTRGAESFVGPALFQALSGKRVRGDLWDAEAEAAMGHIELARWADLVLVAPATANFLATLANGLAPDLLSTLCLATRAPIVVAPAMNQAMWSNPATQSNRTILAGRGVQLIGPAEGEQACGDVGPGRMVEPETIVNQLFQIPAVTRMRTLSGASVMITAGPTREAIDPVRYITNRSSGKMGYALAAAARDLGARVTLVSGPVSIPSPHGVRRVDIETAEEMFRAVHEDISETDIFIGCAAIADYRPRHAATEKIKRGENSGLELALVKAPDTLASVAKLSDGPLTVGFAAETANVEANAKLKLKEKRLDMIAANRVGDGLGFDEDENSLIVLWPGGEERLERASKTAIAQQLMDLVVERFRARRLTSEPTGSD